LITTGRISVIRPGKKNKYAKCFAYRANSGNLLPYLLQWRRCELVVGVATSVTTSCHEIKFVAKLLMCNYRGSEAARVRW
jgi:hypothetical protein